MAKHITKSVVREYPDPETGELKIIETQKDYTLKCESSDKFFMIFIERMASFYQLKQASDIKVLACLCELAEYNTGVIHMTRNVRLKIQDRTGVTISNLSKNLKRLEELQLISKENGDYTLSPDVFWKGEIKKRTEIIKTEGLTFKVDIFHGGEGGLVSDDIPKLKSDEPH